MASLRSASVWRLSVLAQLGLLSACSGQVNESEEPASEQEKEPEVALGEPLEDGPPTGGSLNGSEPTETAAGGSLNEDEPTEPRAPVCENFPEDDPAIIQYPDIGGECSSKADCTAEEYGYCAIQDGQFLWTVCLYGCEVDADCGAGYLCECGKNVGVCTPATCRSDADCGDEQCQRVVEQDPCVDGFGPRTFYRCGSSIDTCREDADCTAPEVCLSGEDGSRSCQERSLCGIGRPFLVDEEIRWAEVTSRSDWSLDLDRDLAHLNRGLTDAERASLASGWTQIALMEHASVAAFARFQLQLLALGAPADLVEATNQALVDETRHARVAFGISRVFSESDVGPGPLSIDGALGAVELEEIALLVLLEGCIGETCAAMEAEWAVGQCSDEKFRSILAEIGADEKRHSELAWRFIAWAVGRRPELADVLLAQARVELEKHRSSQPPLKVSDAWQKRYGLVPERQRHTLRATVLSEIVVPCLAALHQSAA